jgi:hypothetical protein
MDDRNETSSAPASFTHHGVAFGALPLEVLLEVVPHTDVVSTIQMTRVSVFNVIPFTRNED